MSIKNLIGKMATHPQLGRVLVISVPEKSRTKVEVRCVDRGPGWNRDKQKYTGVRLFQGWIRGENKQYGHEDVVKRQELSFNLS